MHVVPEPPTPQPQASEPIHCNSSECCRHLCLSRERPEGLVQLWSQIPLLGMDFLKIIFVSVTSDAVKQNSKHYSKIL